MRGTVIEMTDSVWVQAEGRAVHKLVYQSCKELDIDRKHGVRMSWTPRLVRRGMVSFTALHNSTLLQNLRYSIFDSPYRCTCVSAHKASRHAYSSEPPVHVVTLDRPDLLVLPRPFISLFLGFSFSFFRLDTVTCDRSSQST